MKKISLSLLMVILFTCVSHAQWTTGNNISNTNPGNVGIGTTVPVAKLDVYGDGNYTGSLQVGNRQVNSNTTKLFINNNYSDGKNWAISAGANFITEEGLHIYNWTDNSSTPLLSIGNDGSTSIHNITGGTLTLQKSSNSIPALIFQGATSQSIIEGGDSYVTTSIGGSRRMTILANGNVGIGTVNPNGYMLAVQGNVHAREVVVDVTNWPDYVFKKDYALIPLKEVKTYIDQNQHLPDMPSEQQVEKEGVKLGEMNKLLTKKVEELTLYLIEKDKQLQEIDHQRKVELSAQAEINQRLLNRLNEVQNQLLKIQGSKK